MDWSRQPFLLCEEIIGAVRPHASRIRGRGQLFFFDYEGVLPIYYGAPGLVHRVVDDLLSAAVEAAVRESVFCFIAVTELRYDLCEVSVRIVCASQSFADLPAETRQFDRATVEDRLRRLCQSAGGSFHVDVAPGAGWVATAKLPVPCLAPIHQMPICDAGRAQVWLIGDPAASYAFAMRRFQRLNWSVRTFDTVEATEAHLAANPSRSKPALVVGCERCGIQLESLAGLRQQLPAEARVVLRVTMDSPMLRHTGPHAGILLHVEPMSPRLLAHLTVAASHANLSEPFCETEPAALTMEARKMVLVVDDSEVNLQVTCSMLVALGYETQAARDGLEAVQCCKRGQAPDLVLMDIEMPRLNGFEATQQICALQTAGQLPFFPIVACTGRSSSATEQQCLETGMRAMLSKPFDLLHLQAVLEAHLQ